MSKHSHGGDKNAITADEKNDYDRLRKYINDNKDSFSGVVKALVEMRDRKLYRAAHSTFEAYCDAEHGFTASYARRLIGFAEVSKNVPIGTKPANEAQGRELAKAPPEKRAAVMDVARKASGDKPVTAVAVRRAVQQVIDPPTSPPASSDPAPEAPAAPEPPRDEPWAEYNQLINQLVGVIEQARTITASIGAMQPYASWVDAKQYKTFWDNAQVTFAKHTVTGWVDQSKVKLMGRPFHYASDGKKKVKAA